jgi:putative membrane-bound dehydrogenase-like protein
MQKVFRSMIPLMALTLTSCGQKHIDAPPLSPQESLEAMRLSEDFHVELFLAEPRVVDPVEMVFDENGRIYVAEMLDYPEDPPPGKPARSRIRLLEDTDGDGKIDRSVIFADHVLEVSGILPWKGGLIVTSAPDILYMKDTDGDGKADEKRVLYTGFPKINPEGRITNPRLGIDNWIYCANEGADGRITSPEHPERPPVLVRGTDFRFHPLKGIAEPASGPTQFGMSFNDWGDRFLSQNTTHLRQAVVPMQYLTRAPLLEIRAVSQDISDHGRPSVRIFPLTKPQAWREQRTRLRQQRYNENQLNRIEQVGGYFTAASGGTVYTGDAFPKDYLGNIFTGDVSANLVHRDILTPDGVTFSAHRAKDNVEFLASTDVWFRPCNFANAPDGNLYMIDIYREFIETPESIPEEIKKKMNFWSGDTMGRIYRIVPNHPLRKGNLKPNLGAASTAELVKQLANPNGWHRQTAQRLLVERQDRAAVPLLGELYSKSEFPQARLHALWTLEGLSALDPSIVLRALKDSHPRVREHAIRLSEDNAQSDAVLAMVHDPEPRVQFQLAFTLGQINDRRALEALAELARQRSGDPWFRAAILSSVPNNASELLHLLLSKGQSTELLAQLASLIGTKHDPKEIASFLSALPSLKRPDTGLRGLARGLKLTGVRALRVPGAEAALAKFLDSPSEPVRNAAWDVARYFELRALVQKAIHDATAPGLPIAKRAIAIRALRGGQFASVAPVLRKIFESHEPADLQVAAVESLASFDDSGVGPVLLGYWKSYSPEARKKALDAMLNQRDRVPLLVKALEDRQVEASGFDVAARARLLEYPDPSIAKRARVLLQGSARDRAKIVQSYRDVVGMHGDVARGKKAFDENCAKCHMPRKQGGRVGPDLSGINNKTKEELLTSILDPSYSIEPRFTNYLITTKDGRMHDGVIANETPGAITLRGGSEEGDETILRKNVVEIRASSVSLMPEELEKSLSRQDLADVIAYLRGGL